MRKSARPQWHLIHVKALSKKVITRKWLSTQFNSELIHTERWPINSTTNQDVQQWVKKITSDAWPVKKGKTIASFQRISPIDNYKRRNVFYCFWSKTHNFLNAFVKITVSFIALICSNELKKSSTTRDSSCAQFHLSDVSSKIRNIQAIGQTIEEKNRPLPKYLFQYR